MVTFTSNQDGSTDIDTWITSSAPTTNYGTGTYFAVGENDTDGSGYINRGLIKFDLSSIPPTATVTSATLYLTQEGEAASNARTMRIYRSKRAWTETGATYNKYDGTNNWATAGGMGAADYDSSEVGNISLSATEANGEKTITLSASLINEMVRGTFTNNGFILAMDTNVDDQHIFSSSEKATQSARPKLVIEYLYGGNVIIWSS